MNIIILNPYGIILLLSMIIGMSYIFLQLRKHGIDKEKIFLYFFMFIPFSFIFGKLYTIIGDLGKTNLFTAGLSSYGGFFGIIVVSIIYDKIVHGNHLYIKYSVLALPLIYSLSKIACFVAGCCFGIPYSGPFHLINDLNIALFPIQPFETIISFIVFLFVHHFREKQNIIYITLILVSVMKFFTEYLRYENMNVMISFNQIFSIILLLTTLIIWFISSKRKVYLKSE